jgi:hypothetical protein
MHSPVHPWCGRGRGRGRGRKGWDRLTFCQQRDLLAAKTSVMILSVHLCPAIASSHILSILSLFLSLSLSLSFSLSFSVPIGDGLFLVGAGDLGVKLFPKPGTPSREPLSDIFSLSDSLSLSLSLSLFACSWVDLVSRHDCGDHSTNPNANGEDSHRQSARCHSISSDPSRPFLLPSFFCLTFCCFCCQPHGMYYSATTHRLYVISHAFLQGGERVFVIKVNRKDHGTTNRPPSPSLSLSLFSSCFLCP